MTNPDTLLPKFFGLHRIKPTGVRKLKNINYEKRKPNFFKKKKTKKGRQVRFVVMGNIFASHKRIHERYDLKGSKLGREVSDAEKQRLGGIKTFFFFP